MQLIIEYAKSDGLSRIDGQILQENAVMLKMCRELAQLAQNRTLTISKSMP